LLALEGALGSGKTLFTKGLAEGLGIDPSQVASPTFVIASEYPPGGARGRGLAHVDLYRVEREEDLEAAGFLDLLEPGAVIAVEWADRFPGALPADRLAVAICRGTEPELRRFRTCARGPASGRVLHRWRQAIAGGEAAGIEGVEDPVESE
jgi:tRNA threonylcarbamoyladenosine biosynthesis protein TsaE